MTDVDPSGDLVSGSTGQGPSSCWGATTVPSFPPRYGRSRYDAAVTALRRRVAFPFFALLVVALAGCGSTVAPSTRAAASARESAPEPSLTAVPGGKSTPAVTPPTTTETEFGRIWDDVPASFPRLSTSTVGDRPTPASAQFVEIVGTPASATASIRRALTAQGWSVDVGSPLEDGTVVLEATGQPDGCKAEIRFTPLGGSVIMTVLYGAACPFR